MRIKCPSCEKSLEISNISRFYVIVCKSCEARFRGLEAPVDFLSYRVRGLIPFVFSKEFYIGGSYPESVSDDSLMHTTVCYWCGKRVDVCAFRESGGKQYFTSFSKCPNCHEFLENDEVYGRINVFSVKDEKLQKDGPYTPKQLLKMVKTGLLKDTDIIYKQGWNEWKELRSVKMFYAGGYTYLLDTPDVLWENDVVEFSLKNAEKASKKFDSIRLKHNYYHSNYFSDFGACKY